MMHGQQNVKEGNFVKKRLLPVLHVICNLKFVVLCYLIAD